MKTYVTLTKDEIILIENCLEEEELNSNSLIINAGNVAHYIYFLSRGIVKGYQNIEGKIIVQHLVSENEFFTSLDSFMNKTPTIDFYETISDCKILKISKDNFDLLRESCPVWSVFVEMITNEHLNCKLERVKDFQTLTAKQRYLKFMDQKPNLALNVSVDSMASFLGIEPQSLSRIRKQITF